MSAVAAIARLHGSWRSKSISFARKFKLYKALLVTFILLYGCETWALLADFEKRIQAFETNCSSKLLRTSYLERKTNDLVRNNINTSLWVHRNLLWQLSRDGNGSGM